MNSKLRLIITSTISIILVAVLLIGSTYSIFTTTEIDENTNVYKTGNLTVKYASNSVKITNITPMTPEEADAITPHRITVTNNGNVPYIFDVILTDTTSSADNTIDSKYIMTKVGYLEPKKLSNCTNNIIKEDIILPAGESVDIDVRVWLGANLSNSEIGKSFYAKLSIDGQAVYDDSTDIDNSILSLKYMIASSTNYFRNTTYINNIITASFVDYIDTINASIDATTNEKIIWDMSYDANKPNSVVAWLEDNGTVDDSGNKYYKLYIGSKYKIYAIDLVNFFMDMTNLTNVYLSNLSVSLVKTFGSSGAGMFRGCGSLIELDVSDWNTSNATDMSHMFINCSSLVSLDVSNFDTSNVKGIWRMFSGCSSLTTLDVSNFDTSKVTNLGALFYGCSSLIELDVSNWDTSNVTSMQSMFYGCSNLTTLDVSNFNTRNVTRMDLMFNGCSNVTILDVSNFDTSNVTNMYGMFLGCSSLTTLDVSNFDTINVTNFTSMFNGCSNVTILDVSNFDTSKVTNMSSMFSNCSNLTTLDVSNFDTSKVTEMQYMFSNCSNLTTLDVSNFDTSNVTNMQGMFENSSKVITTITIRNSSVSKYRYVFKNAATAEGASITVNYIGDDATTTDVNESTESLVESMIATKSANSNVVKGNLVV